MPLALANGTRRRSTVYWSFIQKKSICTSDDAHMWIIECGDHSNTYMQVVYMVFISSSIRTCSYIDMRAYWRHQTKMICNFRIYVLFILNAVSWRAMIADIYMHGSEQLYERMSYMHELSWAVMNTYRSYRNKIISADPWRGSIVVRKQDLLAGLVFSRYYLTARSSPMKDCGWYIDLINVIA